MDNPLYFVGAYIAYESAKPLSWQAPSQRGSNEQIPPAPSASPAHPGTVAAACHPQRLAVAGWQEFVAAHFPGADFRLCAGGAGRLAVQGAASRQRACLAAALAGAMRFRRRIAVVDGYRHQHRREDDRYRADLSGESEASAGRCDRLAGHGAKSRLAEHPRRHHR